MSSRPCGARFIKISATGNDFILLDNRHGGWDAKRDADYFTSLCRRRLRVGADGVILLEKSTTADLRYVHINSDGSLAEMCGNGSRAIAWYARQLGLGSDGLVTFEIMEKHYSARVDGRHVTTTFVPPGPANLDLNILTEEFLQTGGFINTGVPHFVIFVNDLAKTDVAGLGAFYRRHPAFPRGANIDFVAVDSPHSLHVRTFERGVEAETLACGTGAVASAVISHLRQGVASPVDIHFPGGDVTVGFSDDFSRVTLAGTVTPVYEGQLIEQVK